MTNADSLDPDDAQVPERRDGPDGTDPREPEPAQESAAGGLDPMDDPRMEEPRASSDESTPSEAPTRRGFLAALAGLGFVHFNVLRLGAPVPTPRLAEACGGILPGQVVQDQNCGVQSPQGPSADGDCGLSSGGGPISQDDACGLSSPGSQGHVSDHDCGIAPGGGGESSGDQDCGTTNTSGFTNMDSNCGKPSNPNADLDCGLPAPLSSYHQDASCGLYVGWEQYRADGDCGLAGGLGFWTDNDCGLPNGFWGWHADNAIHS